MSESEIDMRVFRQSVREGLIDFIEQYEVFPEFLLLSDQEKSLFEFSRGFPKSRKLPFIFLLRFNLLVIPLEIVFVEEIAPGDFYFGIETCSD